MFFLHLQIVVSTDRIIDMLIPLKAGGGLYTLDLKNC